LVIIIENRIESNDMNIELVGVSTGSASPTQPEPG
jgi:hypothetical protein